MSAIALATVLQLPFHLTLALPWLAVAGALAWFTRNYAPSVPRLLVIAAVAAIGLAPSYGAHLSMLPAYTVVLSSSASLVPAILSIAVTWLALVVFALAFRHHVRARRERNRAA
jgi:hypothetical protein